MNDTLKTALQVAGFVVIVIGTSAGAVIYLHQNFTGVDDHRKEICALRNRIIMNETRVRLIEIDGRFNAIGQDIKDASTAIKTNKQAIGETTGAARRSVEMLLNKSIEDRENYIKRQKEITVDKSRVKQKLHELSLDKCESD